MRIGRLDAGTLVRLSDDTYGVVLEQPRLRDEIGVDFWDAPAALVDANELVEIVAP